MFVLSKAPPDNRLPARVTTPSDPAVILSARWAERTVPVSRGCNIRGYHPVREGHGAIAFESLIERDTITLLASVAQVTRIVSQPVTISYLYQKRPYRYTPDFMVEWRVMPVIWSERGFSKRCFIECKPHEKLESLEASLTRSEAAIKALAIGPRVLVTRRELEAWGSDGHGH
jgi:hypothetical protein